MFYGCMFFQTFYYYQLYSKKIFVYMSFYKWASIAKDKHLEIELLYKVIDKLLSTNFLSNQFTMHVVTISLTYPVIPKGRK